MKLKYRLFRRSNGVYYSFDRKTGKQISLETKDKTEATRLLNAKNEADANPSISLHIARTYWTAADPKSASRTWRYAFEQLIKTKHGENAARWERALKDEAFHTILDLPIIETRADHLFDVLNAGTVSTNVFLRRLHNFTLGVEWLLKPVIPKRQWPAVKHREARAITQAEHKAVVEREKNPERRAYYELLWELGGSQGDVAKLRAEDIDWNSRIITYSRSKTNQPAVVRIDGKIESILRSLPHEGALFPYLRTVRACDRATEFKQRCKGLNIQGVTLHSYRYAWAERAKECGYPERFAQQNLGHASKAVTRAYAKKAHVIIPSLNEYKEKVIPVEFPSKAKTPANVEAPAGATAVAG